MEKTILAVALATLAGMVAATANSGLLGVQAGVFAQEARTVFRLASDLPRRVGATSESASPGAKGAFAFCLERAGGGDAEQALRDVLAFHEHAATLSLVECLLDVEPRRFCPPGGVKAAEAMEIYLWSRDDSRLNSPPHGLADKIRMLDRVAEGGPSQEADPFALSWTSPRDRALFDRLRDLARAGYLDPGALAQSGRAELREALRDVKAEATPCPGVAGAP